MPVNKNKRGGKVEDNDNNKKENGPEKKLERELY